MPDIETNSFRVLGHFHVRIDACRSRLSRIFGGDPDFVAAGFQLNPRREAAALLVGEVRGPVAIERADEPTFSGGAADPPPA